MIQTIKEAVFLVLLGIADALHFNRLVDYLMNLKTKKRR